MDQEVTYIDVLDDEGRATRLKLVRRVSTYGTTQGTLEALGGGDLSDFHGDVVNETSPGQYEAPRSGRKYSAISEG